MQVRSYKTYNYLSLPNRHSIARHFFENGVKQNWVDLTFHDGVHNSCTCLLYDSHLTNGLVCSLPVSQASDAAVQLISLDRYLSLSCLRAVMRAAKSGRM
jgi:hypothetical protein